MIQSPLWLLLPTALPLLLGKAKISSTLAVWTYLELLIRFCRYQNGSILIATLQPTFTILHTLTTSRAPAPIVGLAWHGSSAKQKTEMLAIQMADGDLRVWSVSKATHAEPPRIIRILREPDAPVTQKNWCCWSKNGRIVQHSEGYVYSVHCHRSLLKLKQRHTSLRCSRQTGHYCLDSHN